MAILNNPRGVGSSGKRRKLAWNAKNMPKNALLKDRKYEKLIFFKNHSFKFQNLLVHYCPNKWVLKTSLRSLIIFFFQLKYSKTLSEKSGVLHLSVEFHHCNKKIYWTSPETLYNYKMPSCKLQILILLANFNCLIYPCQWIWNDISHENLYVHMSVRPVPSHLSQKSGGY